MSQEPTVPMLRHRELTKRERWSVIVHTLASEAEIPWRNLKVDTTEGREPSVNIRNFPEPVIVSDDRVRIFLLECLKAWRRIALEVESTPSPKARTDDDGKPPLAWLPPEGIRTVARVQAYGHRKYNDFNNYRKGMEVSRNASCAMRHILAFMDGEDLDPESKESHLAHACCRLMFILQNQHDGTAIDDRYKRPNPLDVRKEPCPK